MYTVRTVSSLFLGLSFIKQVCPLFLTRIIAMKKIVTLVLTLALTIPLVSHEAPGSSFKKNSCRLLSVAVGSYLLGSSRSLLTATMGAGGVWLLCTRTPIDWHTAARRWDTVEYDVQEWWKNHIKGE
jgi:hypothetical protein